MDIQNYIFQFILTIISSVSLGSIITYSLNRTKIKAETTNIIGKTYGDLLDDLRATVKYQGEQMSLLQNKELELLKIINTHQEIERELRKQISDLEIKLAKRITKLENN